MKWYIVPSIVASGLNAMLAAVICCLASFHLYSDKSTNAPSDSNEEWICLVTYLVPFSLFWLTLSLIALFLSMYKRKFILASMALLLYVACLGAAIYFTLAFSNKIGLEDVDGIELTSRSISQIVAHGTGNWIPSWLDNIQKQSKQCCGLATYRDYEIFWPDNPTKFPNSCCRDAKLLPSPCPRDLTQIPFPYSAANFVKVESGCLNEINESLRQHIKESYRNCVAMCIFLAAAVLAFLLVYVKRYLTGEKGLDTNPSDAIQDTSDSGAMILATSSEIVSAIDSADGTGSRDNVLGLTVDQPIPANVRKVEITLQQQPAMTRSQPSPSATRLAPATNKTGMFPALFQVPQGPEASTGDDTMTIGGGNLGRQDVFIASDSTDRAMLSEPPKFVQPPRTNSADDVGDIVYRDGEEPPGSPGGRRKKVRRLGFGHHHHQQQQQQQQNNLDPRNRYRSD